ncbi:MAG: transcription elongation factor subunit Spt4 [Halobacteriota archaeon]
MSAQRVIEAHTSAHWSGYLIIIDPKRSEVAKRMNIDLPGRYALTVR